MKTIDVNTKDKKYKVIIQSNILNNIGEIISKQWNKKKIAIISDDTVGPLYQEKVSNLLKKSGFNIFNYQFKTGEQSKSLEEVKRVTKVLSKNHFNRDDGIIALGGGVTGDLSGFIASIYMRGINFIQIPTSLLSQVDSSVGGKTAIDMYGIKNIVGAFYQPDLVIIDPKTLLTLSKRNLIEGYGEIVKVALMEGKSLWKLVKGINSIKDILNNSEELSYFSILFKKNIVVQDEKENGKRQLLNFGHTIGHAIESMSDGKLMHGEAVSIGMVSISSIFEKKELSKKGITNIIKNRLDKVGLPTKSNLTKEKTLINKIKNDKKNHNGYLNIIYLKNIGEPVITKMSLDKIKELLNLC